MDPTALPHWAQVIFYIILALGGSGTALLGYHKKKVKEEVAASAVAVSDSSVISASFIDSKLMKELIEAIRESQDEHGRDAKRSHRLSQDLKESVNELNESIMVQTDTTMNLVRFINREANKSRSVSEFENNDS